jgi:hypothetical protein
MHTLKLQKAPDRLLVFFSVITLMRHHHIHMLSRQAPVIQKCPHGRSKPMYPDGTGYDYGAILRGIKGDRSEFVLAIKQLIEDAVDFPEPGALPQRREFHALTARDAAKLCGNDSGAAGK